METFLSSVEELHDRQGKPVVTWLLIGKVQIGRIELDSLNSSKTIAYPIGSRLDSSRRVAGSMARHVAQRKYSSFRQSIAIPAELAARQNVSCVK